MEGIHKKQANKQDQKRREKFFRNCEKLFVYIFLLSPDPSLPLLSRFKQNKKKRGMILFYLDFNGINFIDLFWLFSWGSVCFEDKSRVVPFRLFLFFLRNTTFFDLLTLEKAFRVD